MNAPCRYSSGFTLVELLVVVVIAGILAAVAMPGFRSLIQSQQAKTASFEMFAAFNLARSEAIKRNSNVIVTPVSGSWQNGWTITTSIGNQTVKAHDVLKGAVVTSGATSVVYARSGRVVGATVAPTFQIDVSSTVTANVRCIKIDLSGMPRTVKGAC